MTLNLKRTSFKIHVDRSRIYMNTPSENPVKSCFSSFEKIEFLSLETSYDNYSLLKHKVLHDEGSVFI